MCVRACIPVIGSTNVTEWLTAECDDILGSDDVRLYAPHSSVKMTARSHFVN